MQIRPDQLAALMPAAASPFIDRLVTLVAGGDPRGANAPGVRTACAQLMSRAQVRGLTTEFEIATFVACGFTYGTDFDSRADLPFRNILKEQGVRPLLKAAQMAMVLEQSSGKPPVPR